MPYHCGEVERAYAPSADTHRWYIGGDDMQCAIRYYFAHIWTLCRMCNIRGVIIDNRSTLSTRYRLTQHSTAGQLWPQLLNPTKQYKYAILIADLSCTQGYGMDVSHISIIISPYLP